MLFATILPLLLLYYAPIDVDSCLSASSPYATATGGYSRQRQSGVSSLSSSSSSSFLSDSSRSFFSSISASILCSPPTDGIFTQQHFVACTDIQPYDMTADIAASGAINCSFDADDQSCRLWKTDDDIVLQVCTSDRQGGEICSEPLNYAESPDRVTVEVDQPLIQPFSIKIVVSRLTSPSVLIIDNLQYDADLCRTNTNTNTIDQSIDATFDRLSQQAASASLTHASACHSLTCSFDDGHFCNYISHTVGDRIGQWRVAKRRIGNIHTGIKKMMSITKETHSANDGGFAFVGSDSESIKSHRLYILESPIFELASDTQLDFDLYQRSHGPVLHVCLNNLTNCPYRSPPIGPKSYWSIDQTVHMPVGTRKVYFVVNRLRKYKWLAIDRIVVNRGVPCTSTSTWNN